MPLIFPADGSNLKHFPLATMVLVNRAVKVKDQFNHLIHEQKAFSLMPKGRNEKPFLCLFLFALPQNK